MTDLDHEQKVAVLLKSLGAEASEEILGQVEINRANRIKAKIEKFADDPVETKITEQVLDDFERFFKFALETAQAESYWSKMIDDEDDDERADTLPIHQGKQEKIEKDQPPEPRFEEFEPGDDSKHDLNKLNPVQIAAALKDEDSRTIAIVLGCIDQSKLTECVESLPISIQGEVISMMMAKSDVSPIVLNRILSTTVDKGLAIKKQEKPQPKPDEKVASVLRELPRKLRSNIVEHLRESNGDEIDELQKMLYVFEDLLNYHDRSIQKILAEVEKSTLITALQDCPEPIMDKILSNLSKRARSSLVEELEFAQAEPEEIVDEARSAVAAVIAELDQSDQLQMA